MPLQPINYPAPLSFDQANPLLAGYGKGLSYGETMASTASKNAYANLMGPQFFAKVMEHPELLANIPDEQKQAALRQFYNMTVGRSGSASSATQSNNVFTPNPAIANSLPSSGNNQVYQNNPALSAQDKSSIQGMKPGESYVIQGNQNYPYDIPNNPQKNNKTFAENAGEYEGVVGQGKEAGTIRAKAADELGQQYQDALQAKVPIDHLIDISQSPTFMNMRNKVPFFQGYQLKVLSKIGTPEEQKMIGDYTVSATNAVAQTINGFRGRILDKEITMGNQMKVSPEDTWDSMIGKLSSAATFNEYTGQRAKIAAQLMEQKHLNRVDALEQADKMTNGKDIREQIEDRLNPPVTIRNKKTGETMKVPRSHARKLGVSNV